MVMMLIMLVTLMRVPGWLVVVIWLENDYQWIESSRLD